MPRDPHEHHRASTPLELLYDLVLVIAVGAAAAGLHHAINEDHIGYGIALYLFLFWSLWWPWLNFTWFASAYDNDDVLYRCLVFLQMAGALLTAVGVRHFAEGELTALPLIGYIVMRVGMIALWLRAAHGDPARRAGAYRYAIGIALCQVAWIVAFQLAPHGNFIPYAIPVMIAEMIVPSLAESRSPTPWHRHHIVERYGLLVLIVFGESLLSASSAVDAVSSEAVLDGRLWSILAGGLLILFGMWWVYFGERYHSALGSLRGAFVWGYSHYFIFASAAAVGAGLAVAADQELHKAEIPARTADFAVSVPVAVYLLAVWMAHDRASAAHNRLQLPLFAIFVLLAPLTGYGVLVTGILLIACLAWRISEDCKDRSARSA